MKNVYLLLAVLGAVVPYAFFIPFMGTHGVDLMAFVGGLFANGAAGGFTADLLITSGVLDLHVLAGGRAETVAVHRAEPDDWPLLRAAGVPLRDHPRRRGGAADGLTVRTSARRAASDVQAAALGVAVEEVPDAQLEDGVAKRFRRGVQRHEQLKAFTVQRRHVAEGQGLWRAR